jgi:zinc protease
MINLKLRSVAVIFAILFLSFMSCNTEKYSGETLAIEFEKYELENGLQVVLHQDKSDPIVSLAIQYGVGSNREKTGRTGFAHLFEHMLFQESENVPQDQFFKKIQNLGGTLNGGTWKDGTIYYEIVPNNALETIMWLESDRMGFLINTVTESAFYNQQEVVQNEKRQSVDNRPYGHTNWVLDKAIYPEGHPYSWQVIGELVDLQNATVEDVKEFYRKFYGPNNATLVLAGDFETEVAKAMIEKYFGEIKRGEEVVKLNPQPVTISETKRLYHEDNFATAAQLNMVWPTLEQYTDDAYALDFLGELLANGKKATMYKVLVEEKELTSRTTAFNRSQELAGAFRIRITANDGVNLADVEDAIFEAFQKFETDGVTDKDVERIKAGLETSFYNDISSILGKSFQLAQYNVFAGDPGFITQDIENIKAVTKEDVMRVYNTYIKDKHYVITSFVPKGKVELAAKDSQLAAVVEEEIKDNVDVSIADTDDEFVKTPSNFDRSVEPDQGESPKLNIPDSWSVTLANGMTVNGMEHNELPLVNFSLIIDGGHLLNSFDKIGVANLITDILMEGTANKTPEELEEEIELLGASINMFTGRESITISGNTLVRNFEKTMDLVEEILLEPRWDEEELKRIKLSTVNGIKRSAANPNVVARNVSNKLLYGYKHMFAYPTSGTVASVESITMDDLKEFYNKNFSPSVSRFHIVGNINKEQTLAVLSDLETRWESKEVTIPTYEMNGDRDKASLYFVDIPNAKQSVINIGYLSMARTNPDYFAATVMNYKLGGSFSGNVNLILREEKGYTYGAFTWFFGTKIKGAFTASSSVRTNTTFESVSIFREEIEKYKEGISQEDLDFTKNALIKSNARRFETQGSLLRMLQNISNYNLPEDYIAGEEEIINAMTLEQHKALANKYLDASKMGYLVIGDAATQFDKFKNAGFDEVILLDKNAIEVELLDIKM